MSNPIARVNIDMVVNGGVLIPPPEQHTVFANNYPIAVIHQLVAPHPPCGLPGEEEHCHSIVLTVSQTVFVKNQGVARKGDYTLCTHGIVTGSDNVFAD